IGAFVVGWGIRTANCRRHERLIGSAVDVPLSNVGPVGGAPVPTIEGEAAVTRHEAHRTAADILNLKLLICVPRTGILRDVATGLGRPTPHVQALATIYVS